MKLKDKNNIVESLIKDSLRELSREFSKEFKVPALFDLWENLHFLDKDKNLCYRGVLEFSVRDSQGRVRSFKKLLDRALVSRKNIGTLEEPKYGKVEQGGEELRRIFLSEIVGKGVAGLAIGLANKTKEQIEEFNLMVPENMEGYDPDRTTDSFEPSQVDIESFEKALARGEVSLED